MVMKSAGRRRGLLDGLSRRTNALVEAALCSLGLLMVVVVAAQVFFRYALNHSLFWSEELARYILVWLTFLGATVAYRRGAHPRIDLWSDRGHPGRDKAIRIGAHLVGMAFFTLLVLYGTQFAYFVRLQISPALQLPKWIVMLVLPVSGLLMLLHALAAITEEIREHDR
jgi:TRAP-type C4-dicarboxylate transport system permease small subunit